MTALPLRQRSAWLALETHQRTLDATNLRTLFAQDPKRGERLRAEAEGIHLDYSKQRVTDETLRLLVELAHESNLAERRDQMFRANTSMSPRTARFSTSRCECPRARR